MIDTKPLEDEDVELNETAPMGGDEDPPEDDGTSITLSPDSCTWSQEPDEQCRTFIFSKLADVAEPGKGEPLLETMDQIFHWIRKGDMPVKKGKPTLKVIDK